MQSNSLSRDISIDNILEKLNTIGIYPKKNSFFIRFEIEDVMFTLFYDGRAILKNATDLNKAKSLFPKYIGC